MRLIKDKARELGITEGEVLYLYSLTDKEVKLNVDLESLKVKGYIDDLGIKLSTVKHFYEEAIDNLDLFNKIYDLYPHKVNGRILKAISHESNDFKYCLIKYKAYNKREPGIHAKMFKGLRNEILFRKKGNSEQYQQDIKTWFNQRTWEKYCDIDIEEETVFDYGKDI